MKLKIYDKHPVLGLLLFTYIGLIVSEFVMSLNVFGLESRGKPIGLAHERVY